MGRTLRIALAQVAVVAEYDYLTRHAQAGKPGRREGRQDG